ncbi:hypothetical protein Tco_1068015 [Tanacetum coccineum]|uniref:Uncharacterized protein n=1 Tax=Tanacetum coccineum TaxID=301880 RepID=A0ABQ5HEJ7_9ASTR
MAQSQRQADVHQDDGSTLEQSSKSSTQIQHCCIVISTMDLLWEILAYFEGRWIKIMQMLYCFINNVHVDYADLLWEGLHYSIEHPSTLIPYLRFTKLIVGHYMTAFPDISRRVRDKYHNLEHDEMVKSIFNSGKNKARVGIQIPSWMITDEIKLTKNYRINAEQKSRDDLEAKQNEEKVKEHLIAEEIDKLVEGTENVEEDEVHNSILNSQDDPGNRLELGSHKESP